MQDSLFVTVKQSQIAKLEKQIKDYGEYCKSIQRCFDKQKKTIEKQKKEIEKQKKEIEDLNKAFSHLFGDAFKDDFKNDQNVEIDCKSDQDVDIVDSNTSNQSSIE